MVEMLGKEIIKELEDIEIYKDDGTLDIVKIGYTCGKIAEDIAEQHRDLEKVLFIVPLRGGLPIWKGVSYGLSKISKKLGSAPEINVMYIPATSTVQDRDKFIQQTISSYLKRYYDKNEFEAIAIIDEAVSGSSSKMVFDSVKNGVKDYSDDKKWKRFYWQKLPVELYLLASDNGRHLNPRIQKLSNVLIYPIDGKIITTDNSPIYPVEYVTEIEKRESSDGKVYSVVKPDVIFKINSKWNNVVREIENGVDLYFKQKTLL
jgi:hypothetical protein